MNVKTRNGKIELTLDLSEAVLIADALDILDPDDQKDYNHSRSMQMEIRVAAGRVKTFLFGEVKNG